MPERARHDDQMLELPEDDPLAGEHIGSQVQKAQEQLIALKRKQDQLERDKRDLEETSRRQDQLQEGKTERLERFTRAIVVLERETYDAQKRVELLHGIHDSFVQHMDYLESINPKGWEGLPLTEINKELNKALSAVDDARAEYTKSIPRISPETSTDSEEDRVAASAGLQLDYTPPADTRDFMYWFKAGLAFTLPLVLIGVILIFILFSAFTH